MPVALSAALALCLAGAAAGAADVDGVLRESLKQRYPDVVRWNIKPFAASVPAEADVPGIVRLGSRSAVRVGRHVYWYAVEGFQRVLRTARAIAAGESFEAHATLESEMDVLAAACEPITTAALLQGARATRALHANEIVCANAVEARPPVARGDEVTVRYVGTRLQLTTRGIAQSDGAVGDALSVRKPGTKTVFRAVVSGAGEVTIRE